MRRPGYLLSCFGSRVLGFRVLDVKPHELAWSLDSELFGLLQFGVPAWLLLKTSCVWEFRFRVWMELKIQPDAQDLKPFATKRLNLRPETLKSKL